MKIYQHGLTDLRACTNLSDLAKLLGVEPRFLSKQIYHVDDASKYIEFKIPKKDGSERQILAPNAKLKFIQSRLSNLLYQCYFDLHGKPKKSSRTLSHGFQRARDLSVFTNASRHTNKRHVFNVDISNFFPSFNFGRVRGYFIKNREFRLAEAVATAIAQTACFKNSLPQGAPSSPVITELISQVLDYRLQSIASRNRCTYSRYVDDITFSTNLAEFPSKIGYSLPGLEIWSAGPELTKVMSRSGFELNPKKIRMQHSNQRQATTNLTVNKVVNVGSYFYKGTRLCAHSMMRTGKAEMPKRSTVPGKPITADQILGKLAHVLDIKGRKLEFKAIRHYKPPNTAPHYLRLMGDFYHYHRVHSNSKPLIICEGKTDYIYLKEAIRWNIKDPKVSKYLLNTGSLASKEANGNHWLIDFLNHTKSAGNLLGITGGGGDLKKFVNLHLSRTEKFHSHPSQKPIILIVDNDKQSEGMWSVIRDVTKSKAPIDGSKQFYSVGANLFIVPIPSGGKPDFYIEKLFPDFWLNYKINGSRTFKIHQKKDEKLKSTEYGKMEFAESVVRANRGKVDCSSFLPLLHTVCGLLD